MRQFRGIGQRRLEMLGTERWVTGQDRLCSGTLAQAVKDNRDRYPGPFRAQLTPADLRIPAQVFFPIRHVLIVRTNRKDFCTMVTGGLDFEQVTLHPGVVDKYVAVPDDIWQQTHK